MSKETYEKVVEEHARRIAPFPPRDLRQCQDRLRDIEKLLARWTEMGKKPGVHGKELSAALYGESK